jgi:hypothetical protein
MAGLAQERESQSLDSLTPQVPTDFSYDQRAADMGWADPNAAAPMAGIEGPADWQVPTFAPIEGPEVDYAQRAGERNPTADVQTPVDIAGIPQWPEDAAWGTNSKMF